MKKFIKRYILHLLYPTRCPVCGEYIGCMDDFCEKCRQKLVIYDGSFRPDGSVGFTAAFIYDDNVSPAVILLKNGICGNAAYALGKALADRLKTDRPADFCDLIIPAPLHKRDKRRRGYNQSELIAKEISKRLDVPYCTDAIVKLKETKSQKTLSGRERKINLNGAFSAAYPELIAGKRILLIDDVCTTGATLAELTKLLKENGAETVFCASCCKTPPPSENFKEVL